MNIERIASIRFWPLFRPECKTEDFRRADRPAPTAAWSQIGGIRQATRHQQRRAGKITSRGLVLKLKNGRTLVSELFNDVQVDR